MFVFWLTESYFHKMFALFAAGSSV